MKLMVPKHILMNSAEKSSIRRLVEYIADPQDKASRIERVSVHNCVSDDPLDAAREMEAVQLLNKRCKADKTYHLLLSFPAGEEPSAEQLERIETDFCVALGYSEHQRVSVVHRDTDNLHVHLAINKIHPEKFTIHEPHRDFKILAKAAELIETTYQLVKTNHVPKKTQSENRVDDVQRMSGQDTLVSEIRTHYLEALQAAGSWDELHTVCGQNGIALQLRGNGLIFTQARSDGEIIAVKASTVVRELSKAKLEARLGTFRSPVRDTNNEISVASSPIKREYSGSSLWKRYLAARQVWQEKAAAEKERLAEERVLKKKLIEAEYKMEKAAARQSSAPHWRRRYRMLELRNEMALRQKQFEKGNRVTGYLEWLQQQAMSGDQDALASLRRRAYGLAKSKNSLATNPESSGIEIGLTADTVTKQGTVVYALGKYILQDRGDSFHVSAGASSETLVMALKMAAKRSGNRLTITGNDAFKEQCLQAAVRAKLDITFADWELEFRRKERLRPERGPEQSRGMTR